MGWVTGIEPATTGATVPCSNQLSYSHHDMVRLARFERATLCLEGRCSIQLSYRDKNLILAH